MSRWDFNVMSVRFSQEHPGVGSGNFRQLFWCAAGNYFSAEQNFGDMEVAIEELGTSIARLPAAV